MLSGAVIEGLAILKGADDETAQKLRDQHNAGHDMTKWVQPKKVKEQTEPRTGSQPSPESEP